MLILHSNIHKQLQMKKLAFIAIMFCTCTAFAQQPKLTYHVNTAGNTDQSEFTITAQVFASNNNNDAFHGVVNAFSNHVGNELKRLAPVTIKPSSISVELTYEGAGIMSLTYTIVLQKTISGDEMYYFDHRGALSVSTNQDSARNDSQRRCLGQFNVSIKNFRTQYGEKNLMTRIPYNYGTIKNGTNYWSISESFFAAAK